jgi:hypothetical protein
LILLLTSFHLTLQVSILENNNRQEKEEKNNGRVANTRPVVSGRNQADIAAITFTIQRMSPTTNGLSGEITIKGESIAPIFDHETQDA